MHRPDEGLGGLRYVLRRARIPRFTLRAASSLRALHLLPTHPIRGTVLRLAFALDGQPPQLAALEVGDGGPAWAQGVLANSRTLSVVLPTVEPGRHTLHLWALDPGVVLDRVKLTASD